MHLYTVIVVTTMQYVMSIENFSTSLSFSNSNENFPTLDFSAENFPNFRFSNCIQKCSQSKSRQHQDVINITVAVNHS